MNCGESGSAGVKTFLFSSSPDSSGKTVGSVDVKTFFLVLPVFSGKNSSSTNVKSLWGQFGPTLSDKRGDCVKKGLKYQVACQKIIRGVP